MSGVMRRTAVRCCAERPASTSAASYQDGLKPTKLTRGISFQYSKEAQKLEDLQRDARNAGAKRIRDVMRDHNKAEPAIVSLMLDLPTKVFHGDKGAENAPSKEMLAEQFKDYVLPVNRFSSENQSIHAKRMHADQLRKQEANREYWRLLGWWLCWAMIGSQVMHVILKPDESIPLLTDEDLEEVAKAKEAAAEK